METLQQLIQRRIREEELTWVEASRRGGWPSHSTLYSLGTKVEYIEPPRRRSLERTAAAIDVPLAQVRAAAARSTGLLKPEDDKEPPPT